MPATGSKDPTCSAGTRAMQVGKISNRGSGGNCRNCLEHQHFQPLTSPVVFVDVPKTELPFHVVVLAFQGALSANMEELADVKLCSNASQRFASGQFSAGSGWNMEFLRTASFLDNALLSLPLETVAVHV